MLERLSLCESEIHVSRYSRIIHYVRILKQDYDISGFKYSKFEFR